MQVHLLLLFLNRPPKSGEFARQVKMQVTVSKIRLFFNAQEEACY
jgi:hypothetical protein